MLHIVSTLRGTIAATLCGINILFWPIPIFAAALLRLIPMHSWQNICSAFLHRVPVYWSDVNNFIIRYLTINTWDIRGLENLKQNDWYLMICNHQSWADILILEYVFNRKIPPLKFFMKKELLWSLPLAGWAAKLIGFPIMHRHTKQYLAKHPDQKGKDIEITRKACAEFKNTPTTIISFIEGTRFTREKHQRQASPYQHLLHPKAGGIAFALTAMGEYFHKILNVTITYPDTSPNLWDFFCGRIGRVIVNIELLPISAELIGDYENNRQFRVSFQHQINQIWHDKDQAMQQLLVEK